MNILKKSLLIALACSSFAVSANAVPAMRGIKTTLTLADGKKVVAELRGDEFCSWWQAEDGMCYKRAAGDTTYVSIDLQKALKDAEPRRIAETQANVAIMQKTRAAKTRGAAGAFVGKKKGLIILVNFSDKKFNKFHGKSYYNKVANNENYTSTSGHVGSVHDYYYIQSNGLFDLTFDVVGPYDMPNGYAYYGGDANGRQDKKCGEMIAFACQMADEEVDFTNYDWDGDGYADQVYVIYADLGQHVSNDDNLIWPHKGQLTTSDYNSSYQTKDNGVKVNTYACSSEYTYNKTANGARKNVDGIGSICHEFSHCLGLVDLYDTQYTKQYGMGHYDIMSSGNYNNNAFSPANYTAYEKWVAGWLEPIVLNEPTTVKNFPATGQQYGMAFVIYNDDFSNEYYILENRQKGTDIFDAHIPTSGLMIMHCDYKQSLWNRNTVNSILNYSGMYGDAYKDWDNDHERFTFFNADSEQNWNYDDGGDYSLYPCNGNNQLTDTSKPFAKLYNGKATMGKPITDIVQNPDGTIDFNFMGGSDSNIISGIENTIIDVNTTANAIYTLDGRRVYGDVKSLGRGVYIINGKKVAL